MPSSIKQSINRQIHLFAGQVNIFMKYKIVAAGLIVILSMVAFGQPIVLAQEASPPWFGTWEAVKAIPPGDKVEIKLKNGRTVKGEVASVSDTAIIVGSGSKSVTTARDDVQQLFRIIKTSSRKPVLVGALVGAGAGVVIGASLDDGRSKLSAPEVAVVGLVGAGLGFLVGRLFRNKKKLILIYESR